MAFKIVGGLWTFKKHINCKDMWENPSNETASCTLYADLNVHPLSAMKWKHTRFYQRECTLELCSLKFLWLNPEVGAGLRGLGGFPELGTSHLARFQLRVGEVLLHVESMRSASLALSVRTTKNRITKIFCSLFLTNPLRPCKELNITYEGRKKAKRSP